MTGQVVGDKDLTAAQLGEVMELTERQVKDRVAKKLFICHWRAGTPANPRSMRFTPEDVAYNRSVNISRAVIPAGLTEAKIRKGVVRLRKAQGLANSPHSNAA